ncbi:unnamed protein product [Acanthoscelides obtectus]|uniref:acid phosphatase n=1 Tax=Acanthoscelides obtectus TaxID=200917 RepID=A0A9P0NWG1_ACAOB|nr:unnamed protein product [Acanthoscelides obtectus]CAK1673895.1 Prostatic acid phosphatase [Acanthoscelides obtectus]
MLNAGKLRAYELGKYIRQRYRTFLANEYKFEEIHVISSDVDRAIMTAESMLAGLYPPPKEDIWFEHLLWEPIPVHTIPCGYDSFISMNAKCPHYDALYEKVAQMEVFQELRKSYPDIFNTIFEKTGWKDIDVNSIKSVVETMYIYSMHNASYVPEWYKKLNQTHLNHLAGVAFAVPTYTKEIQRIRSGTFYNYLVNYLDGVIQGKNPKFLVISGHDTTVASVLNTIDCYDYEPPEFTATVFWEVYKTKDGTYRLDLLYKKNCTSDAEPVRIDSCKTSFIYDEFKATIAPILINADQWKHECFATGRATAAVAGSTGTRQFSFLIISAVVLFFNKFA